MVVCSVLFFAFPAFLLSQTFSGIADAALTASAPGTSLVSTDSNGDQHWGPSGYPASSADGRYVVFQSGAPLTTEDTNGARDVFKKDTATGITTLVSADLYGNPGNGDSGFTQSGSGISISRDGRYIAFQSCACNLVPGDVNQAADIFIKDSLTGGITLVSTGSSGVQANGNSEFSAISADARYVAFNSYATNLVAGDTNGVPDVFQKDLATGIVTRASADSSGIQGNCDSLQYTPAGPATSADGRFVVFESCATNLVPGDANGVTDVFEKDMQTGSIYRVSVDSSGAQALGGGSYNEAVSDDGRYVAFTSDASNLVIGDTNCVADEFVKDTWNGITTRVSTACDGSQANGDSFDPASISADGRYLAFDSSASNLVPGDTNGKRDIFVKDTRTGSTARVSTTCDCEQGDGDSNFATISADGTRVAFHSLATNLAGPGVDIITDPGWGYDVFITTPDLASPEIANLLPNGWVNTDSQTISASYSDAASGINSGTVVVRLDGVSMGGCSVTETGVSCPVSGLTQGSHAVEISVSDKAGNQTFASGSFSVDSVAPKITSIQPSGSIRTRSTTIVIKYNDGTGASGINTNGIQVTLDGRMLANCVVTSSKATSYVATLPRGTHRIGGYVTDNAGNQTAISGTFSVR